MSRPLYIIAREIIADWRPVSVYARPYLDAMCDMDSVAEPYYADSGSSVVSYFLANASTWRGERARAIKAELKEMIRVERLALLPEGGAK